MDGKDAMFSVRVCRPYTNFDDEVGTWWTVESLPDAMVYHVLGLAQSNDRGTIQRMVGGAALEFIVRISLRGEEEEN